MHSDEPTRLDRYSQHALRVATLDTLSVEDAAAILRLGVESMTELIVTGQIPAASLNRKHWVLLREDVLEFARNLARQQQMDRKARYEAHGIPANEPEPALPVPRAGRPRKSIPSLN